ncbi:hypothetical protein EJ06DRAFT_366293 [Trichodelitschia bisporula]|uniref:Uncharacterized protein n=1 Tax=Trichodelitschia bisporula TaxID=703511 RepID=A0A6G1I190_9PEZI|nr:hypothetical protein EJ06DRAFT_366293 [Trichodelitschia bisporula]
MRPCCYTPAPPPRAVPLYLAPRAPIGPGPLPPRRGVVDRIVVDPHLWIQASLTHHPVSITLPTAGSARLSATGDMGRRRLDTGINQGREWREKSTQTRKQLQWLPIAYILYALIFLNFDLQ